MKDHGKQETATSERDRTERTALVGVVTCALGLSLNIVSVILANSLVLLADFFNSSLEFASVTLAWATYRALRKEHRGVFDYGIGKIENISSLFIGLFMLAGVLIMVSLIGYRLLHPVRIGGSGIWIGIACTLVFGGMNGRLWLRSVGHRRKDRSPIVDAQCRLFFVKAVVNGLMFVTFVLSISLRYHWVMYLDTIASCLSVGFVVTNSWKMIRHAIPDLLDRSLEEPLQMLITRQLVKHYDAYTSLDGVRTRYSGQNAFIEISLGFDPDMRLGDVDEIISGMKKGLEAEIPHSEVLVIPRAAGSEYGPGA